MVGGARWGWLAALSRNGAGAWLSCVWLSRMATRRMRAILIPGDPHSELGRSARIASRTVELMDCRIDALHRGIQTLLRAPVLPAANRLVRAPRATALGTSSSSRGAVAEEEYSLPCICFGLVSTQASILSPLFLSILLFFILICSSHAKFTSVDRPTLSVSIRFSSLLSSQTHIAGWRHVTSP